MNSAQSSSQEETWVPAFGAEGYYEVSSLGRIRSVARDVRSKMSKTGTRRTNGRILKTNSISNAGYYSAKMSIEGKKVYWDLHRLVLQSFRPCSDNRNEVNHKNGNKLDNRIENLEWITRGDNVRHVYASGNKVTKKGSQVSISKLTESDIPVIRKLIANGATYKSVGDMYGVSYVAIIQIIKNKTWKHVKREEDVNMLANDYQATTLQTLKEFDEPYYSLLHLALGVAGEGGEVVELIKKHAFHGHQLDRHKLALEIGDSLFYLAALSHTIGYELSQVMQMNIDKLKARYPNGFSSEASKNRKE
jgi:NTP pyrophosphatase (non-canonical NTP hydrolase)